MSRRLALALSLALLALAPLTQTHAAHPAGGGGAAVLLRYRFAPGQTLTYAFDETASTRIDVAGTRGLPGDTQSALAALNASARVGGIVHERVQRIDATGAATVTIRVSDLDVTSTASGLKNPLENTTIPTQTIYIRPDGSERLRSISTGSSTLGAFGIQTGATFPPTPVSPGSRWTTTVTESVPLPMTEALTTTMGSNPSLRITTHHLFAGYGQASGEPVAIVDSTAPISAALDIPSSPVSASSAPTHVVETGAIIVHTLFGLDMGQPVDDQTDENLRLAISQPDAQGEMTTVAVRLVVATSTRLIGP